MMCALLVRLRSHGSLLLATVILGLVAAACSGSETDVGPGPGRPDDGTSTSESPDPDDSDDVATADSVSTTSSPGTTNTTIAGSGTGVPSTTFVVDENSDNARAFTELAASGLVLTLEEQACTDDAVESAIDDGVDRLDAVIGGVTDCASARAVDDFASVLLSAGGASLPPTEAACVASHLRTGDDYRPFWQALFDEEAFDFLGVDDEVQTLYLDLFADCVSVGRALADQLAEGLSPPTVGCIDALYQDREFVRITIEADLSGDPAEQARINSQIAGCLSGAERDQLGF
ncbi:MAG: hypothetical protein ACR2P0_13395 [Acidimicrobiales bacterium]